MTQHDQAAAFFDRFAQTFDTFYEGRRGRWMRFIDRHFRSDIYVRFARTFEVLGDLAGKTVLDIGCGSGIYVIEALRSAPSGPWRWTRRPACWISSACDCAARRWRTAASWSWGRSPT